MKRITKTLLTLCLTALLCVSAVLGGVNVASAAGTEYFVSSYTASSGAITINQ